LAVAMGAAIQAGILNNEMEDDIFITDVNPYALGVRVADMFSNDNMSIVYTEKYDNTSDKIRKILYKL